MPIPGNKPKATLIPEPILLFQALTHLLRNLYTSQRVVILLPATGTTSGNYHEITYSR
jgi:hypothetical protein